MKKIYLSALALSIGLVSFGQNKTTKGFEKIRTQLTEDDGTTIKPFKSTQNNKAPGDTISFEDFTNGLPTGWYVQDNTGSNYDWVINNVDIINNNLPTLNGFTNATAIASTSGGNHMLLFGDEYNRVQLANTGVADDLDSYFQTSGIQVNNFNGVSVTFQQKFRRCCSITPAPETVLAVSTDSTFATNFQEYDIIQGIGGNIQSPDPMITSINISAIAANYTGKIWLRFHVKSGSSHYYNMIDDIAVVEAPTNDLTTQAGYYGFTPVGTFGFQYTRIPAAHIQSADFTMIVDNIGTADQTGTNLTVDINDGTSSIFTQSTTDITIPSLARDTIEMFGQWTPPATVGIPYTVTLDIFSDSTDLTPNNNGIVFPPFQVSDFTVALDDHGIPGGGGQQTDPNGATEHEAGNFMEAFIDDVAEGVEFLAASTSTVGTSIDAVLYRSSGGAFVEIGRSPNYIITAADTTTPQTLNLIDPNTGTAPNLQKDSVYFFGIHSFDDGFRFATSGTGPLPGTNSSQHSTVSFPSRGAATTTFSLTATPMIRLKLQDPATVGVDEIEKAIKFNVFPNPSNGIFNINISSNDDNNVNLTVKNVVGQTVLTKTINVSGTTNHQLSLTNYSKGIYFLTVGNETVKLIIE